MQNLTLKSITYNLLFLFFILLLLVFFTGCTEEKKNDSPLKAIKIGILLPMSGSNSDKGKECLNGILLAIDEINESGGISALEGATLNPIIADSAGIPLQGVSETEKLIKEENVVAIIGAYQSSVAISATEVSEKSETPFLVNVGIADVITERGFNYTFRIIPTAKEYAINQVKFLNYLNKTTGYHTGRVALLHENTGFGTACALAQREALIKAGIEPVIDVSYRAENITNMSKEISQVLASDPDLIIETTYLNDSILIRRGLADAKSMIPLFDTAGGTTNKEYLDELGLTADGTLILSEFSPQTPVGKEMNEKYRNRFGSDISGESAYSYQAIWVLKDALERSKSTDRKKIREALVSTNLTGSHVIIPDDRITFDNSGQNELSNTFVLQIQNGTRVLIWPEDSAVASVII